MYRLVVITAAAFGFVIITAAPPANAANNCMFCGMELVPATWTGAYHGVIWLIAVVVLLVLIFIVLAILEHREL